MLNVIQRLGAIVISLFLGGGCQFLYSLSHYASIFHHLFSLTTWSLSIPTIWSLSDDIASAAVWRQVYVTATNPPPLPQTLRTATVRLAEMFENLQHSTGRIQESRSHVLLICSLPKGKVRKADYWLMASNDWMIHELWIGKDAEQSRCVLFMALSRHVTGDWGKPWETSVMLSYSYGPAEIRTGNLKAVWRIRH